MAGPRREETRNHSHSHLRAICTICRAFVFGLWEEAGGTWREFAYTQIRKRGPGSGSRTRGAFSNAVLTGSPRVLKRGVRAAASLGSVSRRPLILSGTQVFFFKKRLHFSV